MATQPGNRDKHNQSDEFPGYPMYPPSEDMYSRGVKEEDIDPDNPTGTKGPNDGADAWNEKGFNDDVSGGDLDIPGAESDDERESIGSEDEENNYYSLGGDNHTDLEEYKDE